MSNSLLKILFFLTMFLGGLYFYTKYATKYATKTASERFKEIVDFRETVTNQKQPKKKSAGRLEQC